MPETNANGHNLAVALKQLDPDVPKASVVDLPTIGEEAPYGNSLLWLLQNLASNIPDWGTNIIRRDQMLRSLPPKEPTLGGALSTVVARNAAMDWELDGPRSTIKRLAEMVHASNFGQGGWLGFATRFSMDYYSQDKGAFVEIIKDNPRDESSPTIGIANLDSQRCWHTGNPEVPVIYQDRKGRFHHLPYWRVWTSSEMLMPHETLYGLQFCALSRILAAVNTQISINTYIDEKASGRHNRALQIINGISTNELKAALALNQAQADQQGMTRYSQPAIVASITKDVNLQVATVQLAGLPDNFNEMTAFQKYIALLAMGFLTDYLELAPLPGNNLGTATQAETADKKSKAKGAQLWRKSVTAMFNQSGILPKNVEWRFSDFDPEKDEVEEGLRMQRVQRRAKMLDNGEIDKNVARQMALDAGDISQEIFDAMIASEEIEDVTGIPEETEIDDTDAILDDEEQTSIATKGHDASILPEREVIVERDEHGHVLSVREYRRNG